MIESWSALSREEKVEKISEIVEYMFPGIAELADTRFMLSNLSDDSLDERFEKWAILYDRRLVGLDEQA